MKNNQVGLLTIKLIVSILLLSNLVISCQEKPMAEKPETRSLNELKFRSFKIADSMAYVWAHCPADINGDGIVDLVFINNNGYGGTLEFLLGQVEEGTWDRIIIAAEAPGGGTFAQGDLECADIDFDGDLDIVASKHPGEWDESSANSMVYWFENPGWETHFIGEVPNFIKDISLVDFNRDKKMDLAALTYETSTLSIIQQKSADEWEQVQFYGEYKNLHEGMSTGDVDGDGWIDIVANAHIFYSPGKDLSASWKEENLDEKWNNQTGDWSRNGTKVFLKDLDGDKKAEVLISHSERSGYPLSLYKNSTDGTWKEYIIADSIPACHTLQVFDFDLDGDYDVLAGINSTRAKDLGFSQYDVTIFLSDPAHNSWTPLLIESNGIYNGQAADLEQDGDFDIFRYPTHDATQFGLYKNDVIK